MPAMNAYVQDNEKDTRVPRNRQPSLLSPRSGSKAAAVHEAASAYRARLMAFFRAPEHTVDIPSMADYLEGASHNGLATAVSEMNSAERLANLLSTVRFLREEQRSTQDNFHVAPVIDTSETEARFHLPALEQMLAHCEKQNQMTINLLSLLGKPH